MSIGEKIKKARQLNGWTQAQSASISNLPIARIQQYEIGFRNPRQEQLEAIASALGVSMEYFTDFQLDTCHSIMFALFELEDTFGLKLEKIEDKYVFSFDDTVLKSYISEWGKEKEFSKLSRETFEKYAEWKMKFPKPLMSDTTDRINKARENTSS